MFSRSQGAHGWTDLAETLGLRGIGHNAIGAFLAPTAKVPGALFGSVLGAVDVNMDRFMTTAGNLAVATKVTRTLLWHPVDFQLSDNMRARSIEADQLASTPATI